MEQNNVIELFGKKKSSVPQGAQNKDTEALFREVIEKNRETQERLRHQRKVQNKKVLKSFKIKLF